MALKISGKSVVKGLGQQDYSAHLGTPQKTVSKPIIGIVSKEKKKGTEPSVGPVGESVNVGDQNIFVSKPNAIIVVVDGGRTLNLGNYESAKVGVSISIPCDFEKLEDAFDFGSEWVSAKIDEAVKEAKGL